MTSPFFFFKLLRCLSAAVFSGGVLVSAIVAAQPVPGTTSGVSCPPAAMPVPAGLTPGVWAQRSKEATDRGLLWRIEKNGRTSWLYGTTHLGKADWLIPGPRVMHALMSSDTIALELDLLDPSTVAELTAPPDAAAMARMLTPERQRRLNGQVAAACLPAGALAALRPMLQVTALAMMTARADGLYPDYAIESFLAGFARTRHKPVVALETAASQLKLLIGDSEDEEAAQVDEGLDELESGSGQRKAIELVDAWARSDWVLLDSYPQWCDCLTTADERRMFKRLLADRNPGLASGIERLHDSGQRVFGAVGALHMIGTQGLPALLTARGFNVTQMLPALNAVSPTSTVMPR